MIPSAPRPGAADEVESHSDVGYANDDASLWPQESTRSRVVATDQRNAATDDLTASNGFATTSGLATSDASPAQSSPHSTRAGLHGMYLGPASGVSFLVRVQKRLDQAISFSHPGSIFTFGDAPLPIVDSDPSFCMMLPKEDARRLLDRFFDFAMPTFRFLHRPTIEAWFAEFYSTLGQMHDPQSAPAKVALVLMVLAHGRMYMPDDDRPGPVELGFRLFLSAEHQLSREMGAARLTSIQARLTMCFFLLTQSKINQAWTLFGTTSHLALAIGLNRSRRFDTTSVSSQVEAESRRRLFWCAYTLDAHLAVVLGRPRLFHDDDIDIELPRCLEDNEISANTPDNSLSRQLHSTMLAPIAHYKLARLVGKILRDLYSIKAISSSRRAVLNERISRDLSDWRVEFADFLDAEDSGPQPIFQRGRNVLNLTYWHAIILTHRPLVLASFAGYSEQRNRSGQDDAEIEESVRECLRASMLTVGTVDMMIEKGNLYRSFWIAAYFSFSASVLLYIYVLHRRASPPEVYSEYLAAAVRCQSHMSGIAEKGSLAERYCLLLEELRVEAVRQTELMRPTQPPAQTTDFQWHGNNMQTSMPVDGNNALGNGNAEVATEYDMMAADPLPFDYSGWTQFAEIVSSGSLGNLDTLLGDDSFRF